LQASGKQLVPNSQFAQNIIMKAFIFVALVASVAARSLDLDTLRLIRERSLLNQRPVVDDLLLKERLGQRGIERLPIERSVVGDLATERVLPVEQRNLIRGQDTLREILPVEQRNLIRGQDTLRDILPVEQRNLIQGQDTLRGIYDVDQVLSFEEIYNTELFQQYLNIPLFRQYIQYPIFQRYISSVYFQRFWQLPTFRQYFINPVLFYKYIYPIVQLFKNEYTLPTTTFGGQDEQVYGQGVYGRQTLEDLIVRNRNVLPYVYGQQDVYNRLSNGLPSIYGQQQQEQYYPSYTQGQEVNYKFLLEKLFRTLFQRQPIVEPVTEVNTDVRVFPQEKVVVEPITGERVVVDEPRIVDVKVNEQIVPVDKQVITPVDQVLPIRQQVVDRDVLVREQLLKDLVKEKYITPEIYETIRDIPTIRREGRQFVDQYNQYNQLVTPVTRDQEIYTPFLNRYVQQGERVNQYNNLYNQLYNTEIPTYRQNTIGERLPLEQLLRNIVA